MLKQEKAHTLLTQTEQNTFHCLLVWMTFHGLLGLVQCYHRWLDCSTAVPPLMQKLRILLIPREVIQL